jgi:tetratricopeptide (TPR) repeat protein
MAELSKDAQITYDGRLLVILATAWGSKYGGINSFNYDLCCALPSVLQSHRILCVTLSASKEEIAGAANQGVELIGLGRDLDREFSLEWTDQVIGFLSAQIPVTNVDWWIGHDVKSGEFATAIARRIKSGKSVLIMHMSYDDYQYVKHLKSEIATKAVARQRKCFSEADMAFGVGPLLYDRARSLRNSSAPCERLIPGLPDPATELPRRRLSAVTFGRFEITEALIKQVPLAVAGFAAAISTGRKMEVPAFEDAALHVIGVPDEEANAIRKIGEKYAGRLLNIRVHEFITDRRALRSRLEESNLSMMLSWHEGFGLTAWEAIGMGIPTIISRESGVFRLLNEIGGQATGCVSDIDVRGSSGSTKFTKEDLQDLCDIILKIGSNLPKYIADADQLSRLLRTQQCYTWTATASSLAHALKLPVKTITLGPTGLDRKILHENIEIGKGLDYAETLGALRLAEAFIQRGEYDNALTTLDDVGNQSELSQSLKVDILLLKGETLLRLNRYPEAERIVAGLSGTLAETEDVCKKFRAESILNTIYRDQGAYDKAVEVGRTLVVMTESGCPTEIAGAKRKLARALALQGAWQEALKEATESLLLARADRDVLGEAKALLATGEAHRHGLNQVEAIKAYTNSRYLSGKAGHVDCYLWAALGLADSLFLVGEIDEALVSLARLESFVKSSNQQYPLESLHISFSKFVIEKRKGGDVDPTLDDIANNYQQLGVEWPRIYLDKLRNGDYSLPKKF